MGAMPNPLCRLLVLIVFIAFAPTIALPQVEAWRKKTSAAGLAVGINPLNPRSVYAERYGYLIASYDEGLTWIELGEPGITFIRQILVHPSDTMTIFCLSGILGLRKSTDYGATWRTVLGTVGIDGESMVTDPLRPDTMFVGNFSGGQVYRSMDRGETWERRGTAGENLCALAIRSDSSNIMYAGTGGGRISKSTDYGASWYVVKRGTAGANFQETPRIVIHPTSPMIAYATTYGSVDTTLDVWKTTDGGTTWTISLRRTPTWALEIDPVNPDIVYAGTFDRDIVSVFRSTDAGENWQSLERGFPSGGYMWSLKVHPLNPAMVWVSVTHDAFGEEGIYKLSSATTIVRGALIDAVTRDTVREATIRIVETGDSANVSPDASLFSLAYFDGDPTLTPTARVEAFPYYVKDTSVYFTTDSTRSQDILLWPLEKVTFNGSIVDSQTLSPVAARITMRARYPGREEVFTDSTDANGEFRYEDVYVSEPVIVAYPELVVEPDIPFETTFSHDLSITASTPPARIALRHADVLVVSAGDSGRYLGYYLEALRMAGYATNSWNRLERGGISLRRASEFSTRSVIYYTGNRRHGFAAEEHDSLLAALDAGVNLLITGQDILELNDSLSLFSNRLGIAFAGNTITGACLGVPGEIFAGTQFFTQGIGANNQVSRDSIRIFGNGARKILSYGTGSTTAGVRVEDGGAGSKVVFLGFGFESIHTDAKRMSVIKTIIDYFSGTTSVATGHEGDPGGYELRQNFPNPFNPRTTLQFSLLSAGHVRLALFDMMGREVDVLVNGWREAGLMSVQWDGSAFASGLYLARLSIWGRNLDEQRFERKLMLMK